MHTSRRLIGWPILVMLFLIFNNSCNAPYRATLPAETTATLQASALQTASPLQTIAPTSTPRPLRQLTVCTASEPASLFLYGDVSQSAQTIGYALRDEPVNLVNFTAQSTLLEQIPSLSNGGAAWQPIPVKPGEALVDSAGALTTLKEGVVYLPAGCQEPACAQTYAGQDPIQMDQLVVQYKLRQGVQWSDGAPVTADDSLFSYEVARSLFPAARSDLLNRTFAYQALDAQTTEWRSLPGDVDPTYPLNYFTPLPRHAWQNLTVDQLASAEVSSRKPLSYGPYQVDEWISGDHLQLSQNPYYFRKSAGLPHFDRLVFRFIAKVDNALQALQAGSCDILDESYGFESQLASLTELSQAGTIQLLSTPAAAWEQLTFGQVSLPGLDQPASPRFFQSLAVRQAVAYCIDRQRLIDELLKGLSPLPAAYLPPDHPLANADLPGYPFDPAQGAQLLEAAGWREHDHDPETPRQALGLAGIPDGTPFTFELLIDNSSLRQESARIIQESLRQCGIQVKINSQAAATVYAPGPQGPIFGRHFSLAMFAWPVAYEPSCWLYTTPEIPGPYPQYPRSWGGANAGAFSNPEYDQACQQALHSLPDNPLHRTAHAQAQAIFAAELPVIPLFLHPSVLVARPDLCGLVKGGSPNALWNLVDLDYGDSCPHQN